MSGGEGWLKIGKDSRERALNLLSGGVRRSNYRVLLPLQTERSWVRKRDGRVVEGAFKKDRRTPKRDWG